ncbi:MAG: amidohydrolase, partial [Bryobacteraceae bacterium]
MKAVMFAIFAPVLFAQADRAALLAKMDAASPAWGELSRKIWEYAEAGYKEKQSAALLKSKLGEFGFR